MTDAEMAAALPELVSGQVWGQKGASKLRKRTVVTILGEPAAWVTFKAPGTQAEPVRDFFAWARKTGARPL